MANFEGGTQAGPESEGLPRFASINREYAQHVEAEEVSVEQAAVLQIEADSISTGETAIVALKAERATVRDSAVVGLAARSAACDGARVGVLAAPVVRGEVHTWLDLRTAFAVGLGLAVGGFAISVARELLGRLQR